VDELEFLRGEWREGGVCNRLEEERERLKAGMDERKLKSGRRLEGMTGG
jgi:hypothetical protein